MLGCGTRPVLSGDKWQRDIVTMIALIYWWGGNTLLAGASAMAPPKVFISYSHEEPAHDAWVLELAASLRKNGVDAALDQWDLLPGHDVALFMESQIRDSDFVVLICTPTYAEKSNIARGGVGYEKNIISAEMLQAQDLRPKFIPILRKGEYASALPTYLGSRYGVDFRLTRDRTEALDELLRAIHEITPPSKPPIGPNPFMKGEPAELAGAIATPSASPESAGADAPNHHTIQVDGHVESCEARALGRFEFLRDTKIDKAKSDPFEKGYWHASIALQGRLRDASLAEFLEILRNSKTGRTGWDIGWVPTREGIAPYPFQDGIEVWLAESGGKGSGHSDFWRAERIGTFSLIRGYQEDEPDFVKRYPNVQLDYSLVLWRISELLLYLERFSQNLSDNGVRANVRVHWTGLEGRRLGSHKAFFDDLYQYVCHQPTATSQLHVADTRTIRKTLIRDVHAITKPLFEVFDFFSVTEEAIKQDVKKLFDADTETDRR